jgi:hypothetical protein
MLPIFSVTYCNIITIRRDYYVLSVSRRMTFAGTDMPFAETDIPMAEAPQTSVGLNGTSVGLNGTSVGLNGTSVGLNRTSVGLNRTSVGLNGTSVGLNGTAIKSINPLGTPCKPSMLSVIADVALSLACGYENCVHAGLAAHVSVHKSYVNILPIIPSN